MPGPTDTLRTASRNESKDNDIFNCQLLLIAIFFFFPSPPVQILFLLSWIIEISFIPFANRKHFSDDIFIFPHQFGKISIPIQISYINNYINIYFQLSVLRKIPIFSLSLSLTPISVAKQAYQMVYYPINSPDVIISFFTPCFLDFSISSVFDFLLSGSHR